MINIYNLSAGYHDRQVLHNIDLQFKPGSFTALLGPNGAGKTTLLKCLSGYLAASAGRIVINGKELREYRSRQLAHQIALIPQNFQLQFEYQVRELVLMGRFPYLGYLGSYTKEDKEIVRSTLHELDLLELADKNFSELSGGEQQRVAIARALVQCTPILLLDEAFASLDVNHAISIMQLLSEIHFTQDKTIILVSHNINLAVEYCTQAILMKDGQIIRQGQPKDVITEASLVEVYEHNIQVITNPVSGQPNLVYSGYKR
ncbi:MAG: ABC transporter ATP-binding protein [Candidatus Cloacimonetes bacterium]|nr:ABC transporter ATP-binding protein [Candidatus Cloacimonadota bacterium]